MQAKFPFKINEPTAPLGKIYGGSLLDALDSYIKEKALCFLYIDDNTFTKENVIGLVQFYNFEKGYVFLNIEVLNDKFQNLKNIEKVIPALPKVIADEKDNLIKVKEITHILVFV